MIRLTDPKLEKALAAIAKGRKTTLTKLVQAVLEREVFNHRLLLDELRNR